jgi:hypothetical protein
VGQATIRLLLWIKAIVVESVDTVGHRYHVGGEVTWPSTIRVIILRRCHVDGAVTWPDDGRLQYG